MGSKGLSALGGVQGRSPWPSLRALSNVRRETLPEPAL